MIGLIVITTDDQKRQHRYLQTVTAHRPLNLIEAGAPPPRNADAPLSSLTGHNVFNVPSQATMRPSVTPSPQSQSKNAASSLVKTPQEPTSAPRPSRLRTPRKAAMTLTSSAISQLRKLLDSPDPKLIRVGVKNRGCSGLAYHLEYVDKPGKFDEEVVQDGVRVLIDSKALFSIIGSEMDWVEDKLSARFVFKNPNIKEQCGCGESFSVGN
ncbi:putative iron-sulfur cluster assembly accessory protein Isa1 [Kalaharituber pfeilii]|nr:putative iron-sulfur cluster assembly accessory protein Isa1 [Kalaharituber pfeilii]